ncbi:MAG: GumC family protein, partial [Fulvivirga sp.]
MRIEDRNTLFESEVLNSTATNSNSLINYRRILFKAIRYWYVVLICILAAISIAFLVNRYTTKIYNVEASIIIKESQENNIGGQLLYNNALVEPYRNYYNELYIIKSLPLIQSVVDTLGFDVSIYRQGDIKTSEFYDDNFPVKIEYDGMPNGEFQLMLVDDSSFILNASTNTTVANDNYYSYGEKIEIEKSKIVVSKRFNSIGKNFLNKEYVLVFKNIKSVANRYRSRLGVSWQEQGASVVNLTVRGALPTKEMSFLDELTKQYQRLDLKKKNQAASRSIAFIDSQLKQISDSLQYFEFKVESFKKDYVVTNIDGEALRLYQRIEDLEGQLGELTLKKNYLNYLTDYLTKDTSYDQVVPPSSVGVEDPIMTQLISNLVQLQSTVQLNASLEKASTPLTQRKKDQIEKTKSDLLESVRSSLGAQKINEDFLRDQIKFVDNQLARLPESERRLINLQRNYALSENLYIFMMQKRA